MQDKDVARLSDSQKTCLRLVGQGMSSKDIARHTGLSPATVDTYIKDAIALTGAGNRREAARIFSLNDPSQKLGPQSQQVADLASASNQSLKVPARWFAGLGLPPIGGSEHDLSPSQKTVLALRVAVIGAAVVLALMTAIAGVLDSFR